jgi:hypothetical protein
LKPGRRHPRGNSLLDRLKNSEKTMKTSIKTISHYLLFVGLSLLGVLGALGIGRNLSAPATVHGVWVLSIPGQTVLECQAFAGWKGEMVAGILFGPSMLSLVAPRLSAALLPHVSLGYLSALSQIGLVLFMFLVGLELEGKLLRNQGEIALFTSHASVSFVQFALFLGTAISITAFPMLATTFMTSPMLEWVYFSRVVPKEYGAHPDGLHDEAATFSVVD